MTTSPARRPPATLRTRILRMGLVAVLGLALGIAIFYGWQVASAPGTRPAPGWIQLAEMPVPRGETAVAMRELDMVVIGGLTGIGFEASAEVSVLQIGAWEAGPRLPEPRHHAAAAAIGDDVYLSGGASSIADGAPRREVWVLRGGSETWDRVSDLPTGRFGHRMVALDGRLYVVGDVAGTSDAGVEIDPGAVLVYEPASDTWTTAAPIPLVRDHLGVVVVDGEIWAIGGRAGGINHARVDVYDPASDAWRDGPPLPSPTSGAAEGVWDGTIIVSGGEDPGLGAIVDEHWALDTTAASPAWVKVPPPFLAVHGVPGAVSATGFIVAGGSARAGGQSNTAWTGLTQVLVTPP